MIEIKVDTSKLETAIAEFARLTRADLSSVIKTQAGILVGHIIATTPPGNHKAALTAAGGIGKAAKAMGEAAIRADIERLFPAFQMSPKKLAGQVAAGNIRLKDGFITVKVKRIAETEAELRALHQAARSKTTGRTSLKRREALAATRQNVREAYIKKQLKRVGLLNAGWINAARELRTSSGAIPAWITRHGAQKGGAEVKDRGGAYVSVRIFNQQAWFPQGMEARVEDALRRRHHALLKAMEAVLARRAKAAERRMTR